MSDKITVYDQYKAALDSVWFIEQFADDPKYVEHVARNREHLRIVLDRKEWPPELDLSPLQAAAEGE